MEENKFEKQVQRKMDELKIQPSDAVWEKIAVRINKKKRSNKGFIFFILLFCFFLTAGYLFWNTGLHSIRKVNIPEEKYPGKSAREIPVIKNNNDNNSGAPNKLSPGLIPKRINTIVSISGNNINKNSSRHLKRTAAPRIKINLREKATLVLSAQQEVKDEVSENTDAKPAVAQPVEVQAENEKIKAEIKSSAYDKLNKDSLSKPSSLQDEKARVKDTLKQMPASSETAKPAKKNKWKFGLLFSGGISGVGNNFLGLVNSPAYDYLNSASAGGQVGGPGTMPLASPSRTKSKFGFMGGVFAERNISSKSKLVTGINFKSFNTSNKVGIRNDTTGRYNSQNSVNTYKNHYNFIELPVTLKMQIGRGKNIPLFWEGGLVVSELISSNALQFNPISGLYDNNNSIFNKTQIGLNTSLSAALFSKQKKSVLIGPYFYYDASRLANEGLYNKKHFVFTGLRTEIIFGK